ncbi:rpoZ: DNA-directed RNA polymerase, omega subunit [Rubrobacter radiotolerans]|uniref:DNA-directed RNA polymerase subunit omega n=1 Tax=Rubrobacter radiotolerans TaxID=42256 RepID=A0A023X2S4_RUBRA|nr:DNA-directed RNA polymerase subunit omega [Rubrobacter radiotolerans]AHY46762.1 rpoZ: DNA-directed RNA polymerase, omega subunit [Rubrobacter radiotolerans]MDX5894169.1 DNA-directed RNA polymerase subunit omega [Rubrobacter radiotolerans]SMC05373.1 DNA-directed RNA polymerase subunit omega [Rubrobacter radiotolerans DSM 5868]
MLNELKVDELLDSGKVDSRYGLVIVSARRARQINEYTATLGLNDSLGIPGPQVHTRSQHPISIAIEELREGKLIASFREEEEPETAAEEAETPDAPEAMADEGDDVSESAAAPDEVEEGGVPAADAGVPESADEVAEEEVADDPSVEGEVVDSDAEGAGAA